MFPAAYLFEIALWFEIVCNLQFLIQKLTKKWSLWGDYSELPQRQQKYR